MSYRIFVTFDETIEVNRFGDISKVQDAILLNRNNDLTKLDIAGDFDEIKERTRKICNAIIDAGFVEFSIEHSY